MSSAISTLSQSQISSLEQSEKTLLLQPVQNWQNQITTDQTKLSAWGSISGAISSLDTALSSISDPATVNNRTATSSDKSIATATVSKDAKPGQYNLSNVKLAKTQELYSKSYASASTALGGGSSGSLTFSFANGKSETINVSAANNSLNGIAQAINQKTDGAVSASVIGGSTGDRLAFTGNETGSQQAFTVSGAGGLSGLGYNASGSGTLTQARAATNATLKVNGVPVSGNSNTLTSVIPDGSITLAGSGSASIGVKVDSTKLSTSVSSVISKINSAVSTIDKTTALNKGSGSSGGQAGPLLGNYSASDLSNELLSAVSGLSTGTVSGRGIGITISKDGSVKFDSDTFAAAFKSNPSGVNDLVKQLHESVGNISKSALGTNGTGGFIKSRTTSLNQSVSSLKTEITQQSSFVNQQMNIYIQQFGELQSKQNALQTQSNYLSLLSGSSSKNG